MIFAQAEALVARSVAGVRVPNAPAAAAQARDALLKGIYARLFDRVVSLVNSALGDRSKSDAFVPRFAARDDRLFVGLLDIFGFECFQRNSLEQLLINYANERLQRHFNLVVFETEARLYFRPSGDLARSSWLCIWPSKECGTSSPTRQKSAATAVVRPRSVGVAGIETRACPSPRRRFSTTRRSSRR